MAISQYENEYYGLSGDVKPLGTPLNGRKFTEMDTSKEYRYDAENQQWLQQSGGGGGSSTLSGLTDVDISNPANGQTLVYNAESGKWENGDGGVFIINNVVEGDESSLDKTYAEIKTAYLGGRICLVYVNGGYAIVTGVFEDVEQSFYSVILANGSTYQTDSPSGYPVGQR